VSAYQTSRRVALHGPTAASPPAATRHSIGTRARVVAAFGLALAAFSGCSAPSSFHPREVVIVARDTKAEEGLAFARQSALDGELEAADAALRRVLERHGRDPLAAPARLMLARVLIARGDLPGAAALVNAADGTRDEALGLSRTLLLGLLAVRQDRDPAALALLRPLAGRLPDRAETAQLSCALAAAEARAGETARALQALAAVESVLNDGVSWIPTGLPCERPDTRLAQLDAVLSRTQEPQVLADALDALPTGSAMRRPLAVRLHSLAQARHELPRWLRWLADLPDESAPQAPLVAPQIAAVTVGVLAPLAGAAASTGLALVRGVQYGLEDAPGVQTLAEDEGDTPTAAAAALDRLAAHGARVVIGVVHAEFSAGVAIRAQALGIDLWLVAPARGVAGAGSRVHAAGPELEARVEALADAARARGARVTLVTPGEAGELESRVQAALTAAGVGFTRATAEASGLHGAAPGGLHLVLGAYGHEAQTAISRAAEHAPARWLLEARSALPGASGTWIGVRQGAALAELLPRYCARLGEPPAELSLLGFDAARAAVARVRAQPAPPRALAAGWPLVLGVSEPPGAGERAQTGASPDERPAAALRCPPPAPAEHPDAAAPSADR
jgi:hypothetical protein